jgi:DNA-binding transcriptional MerR regulator
MAHSRKYDALVTSITQPGAQGNGAGAQASMTIDELARRTGMTVRNIRAHQSRGLVPPPEVRGRTGYYGEEHLARIELIKELQADGFNLEAIRRLLEGAGGSGSEVLSFSRALRAPFEDEQPEIIDAAEMAERWGGPPDPALIARAEKLGLMRGVGDGRIEILSPRLHRAGLELAELGVPAEVGLEVAAQVRTHARRVARVFIELFMDSVWKPFNRAGRPEEEWPKVRDALERLRPLASEAFLAIFQQVMSEAVEQAAGRELQRELSAPEGGARKRSRRPRGRRKRR